MHYGWIIVSACLIIGMTAYGTYFSFTLFYPHLVQEFGWSRTVISGAMSIGLISYGLFAFPMGWCADRLGPLKTTVIGGAVFGVGTALGAYISEVWHLYVLYGGLTAVGMGTAWAPLVSTISRWFETNRGLAVGIGSLGGGTGMFVFAPLVDYLILELGWRLAYLSLGVISGSLMVGFSLLLARDPATKGLKPYGSKDGNTNPQNFLSMSEDYSLPKLDGLRSIMFSFLFWRMAATFGLWWFGGAIIFVHLAPFVLEKGFDLRFAALTVTLFGLGTGIGKVVMGLLGDLLGERPAYQISILVAAVSMLGITICNDKVVFLIFAVSVGFGHGGASTQLTTITASLFGLKSIGTLMGIVLAFIGLVGAGGPLVSGVIYDMSGSYVLGYITGSLVFFCSLFLSTTLRSFNIAKGSRI